MTTGVSNELTFLSELNTAMTLTNERFSNWDSVPEDYSTLKLSDYMSEQQNNIENPTPKVAESKNWHEVLLKMKDINETKKRANSFCAKIDEIESHKFLYPRSKWSEQQSKIFTDAVHSLHSIQRERYNPKMIQQAISLLKNEYFEIEGPNQDYKKMIETAKTINDKIYHAKAQIIQDVQHMRNVNIENAVPYRNMKKIKSLLSSDDSMSVPYLVFKFCGLKPETRLKMLKLIMTTEKLFELYVVIPFVEGKIS